jgi:type I restriction enzyme M protein
MQRFVDAWKNKVKQPLLDINSNTDPKELIRTVGLGILHDFESAQLLNNYDVYDFLLNYWNEKMQDDAYIIKASGYEAGREIEYVYAQKKSKDENGDEIKVDYTSKMKSFEGALISRNIIEHEYFETELLALNEVLNAKGDGIPKRTLIRGLRSLIAKGHRLLRVTLIN